MKFLEHKCMQLFVSVVSDYWRTTPLPQIRTLCKLQQKYHKLFANFLKMSINE